MLVQAGVSQGGVFAIRMGPGNGLETGFTMIGLLRKQRIFRETVKDRQTTHWDLDLLSHEELAAAMTATGQDEAGNVTPKRAEKKLRATDK